MRNKIVPAILAKSADEFQEKLRVLEKYFSVIQIDIMDGKFVKNKTFFDLTKIRKMKAKANYELHLMVEDPDSIIEQWLRYEKTKRIIIHYESFHKKKIEIYDTIKKVKQNDNEVGIAINPNTTVSKVLEFLPFIEVLVVMGVNPGWSGQTFQKEVLEKIRSVRKYYPKLNIAVDGGVNRSNYKSILKAGANILNSASMIFKLDGDAQKIKTLKSNVRKV